MRKIKKGKSSLVRVLCLCITLIIILSIVTYAGNLKINNVTIKFSNSSEMSIVTSKTKVSEILKENRIVLLPEETVVPGLEEMIEEDKTIRIVKKADEISDKTSSEDTELILNEILSNYAPIVEKVIVEQVEIPFETVTKDISSSSNTQNRVIQAGKNGVKEVTYKVKYRNEIEIEREELESRVIKDPQDKIIQVSNMTTARSGSRVATTNPAAESSSQIAARVEGIDPYIKTFNTSAYCACMSCCGKTNGITASGAKASSGYTIAAGSGYKMGTVVYIPSLSGWSNGGWFVVQDRGSAISNSHIDIYMDTHSQAIGYGRKNLEVYVYEF